MGDEEAKQREEEREEELEEGEEEGKEPIETEDTKIVADSCDSKIRYAFSQNQSSLDEKRTIRDPNAIYNPSVIYLYLYSTENLIGPGFGPERRQLPATEVLQLDFLPQAVDKRHKTGDSDNRRWWSNGYKRSHPSQPKNAVVYRLELPRDFSMVRPSERELKALGDTSYRQLRTFVCNKTCDQKFKLIGSAEEPQILLLCPATVNTLTFSGVSAWLHNSGEFGSWTPFYSIDRVDSPDLSDARLETDTGVVQLSDWDRCSLLAIRDVERGVKELKRKMINDMFSNSGTASPFTAGDDRMLALDQPINIKMK